MGNYGVLSDDHIEEPKGWFRELSAKKVLINIR